MIELNHEGLKFMARDGYSDEKTFHEVIVKETYFRRDFRVESGERWLDLGGNVGAFTILASKLGASVTSYEPDPGNVAMIRENLRVNNLNAVVVPRAIVHDDTRSVQLNLWPKGQTWRNSIVRNKKGTVPMTVFCDNFFKVVENFDCVKMDIEGAEIPILTNWRKTNLKKLVFEWSFDAEPKTEVLKRALALLKEDFKTVKHTSQIETIDRWTFFPPCTMVICTK